MLLRRIFQVSTGTVLGLVAVAIALQVVGAGPDPLPPGLRGHRLPAPVPAPDLSLVTHRGTPFTRDSLLGRASAVFFGYTSCPDVCPVVMSRLGRVLASGSVDTARVRGYLVTVDPAVDTAERLEAFLARHHPALVGLRGDEQALQAAARGFGAYAEPAPEAVEPHAAHGHEGPEGPDAPAGDGSSEGAPRIVGHTSRIFLLDPEGRVRFTLPAEADVETLAAALDRLGAGTGR